MHAMVIKGGVLGVIGGLVGAAVWAAIYHFAHVEIGWIAVGIGALVGILVQVGAGEHTGTMSGFLAVGIAIVCLAIGKFGGVMLEVKSITAAGDASVLFEQYTSEDWISQMADEEVYEREERGETINWPDGVYPDEAWGEDAYPTSVWRTAAKRWNGMSAQEQQDYREQTIRQAQFAISGDASALFENYTTEDWICQIATDEALDREDRGESLDWPDGYDNDNAWGPEEFPPDVWRSAVDQWNGMTAQQQQDYRDEQIDSIGSFAGEFESILTQEGFVASFTLWDWLWFGLAIVAAFKLGSGGD